MVYEPPQLKITQQYTTRLAGIANPLRALVVGPNAVLRRYSDPDEKTLIQLGDYDPDNNTDYDYPNRPAGGIVDQSYFKLYAEDAMLRYLHDTIGSGGTQTAVDGFKNRIRSSTLSYKTHTAQDVEYVRSGALYDRDVAIGDIADISGTVDGQPYTVRAVIRGLVGDLTDATIGTATSDSGNQATVGSTTADVAQSVGPYNCVTATADASGYDGAEDGAIQGSYRVEVVQSSVDGDFTTARLRVTSSDGADDASNVTPAAAGDPTSIGSRGMTLTFDLTSGSSCSLSAEDQEVVPNDLLQGQVFVIEYAQMFTAPVATSGGEYLGTDKTKYIIKVVRGGHTGDTRKPLLNVSTQHGTDSGQVEVTGASTAIAIGSFNLTISFNQTTLCKNDVYYIDVVPSVEGYMRTLVLSRDLPADMLEASDLGVSLYIKRSSIEVPRKRSGEAPDVNYELGDSGSVDSGFTVPAGMKVFDSEWTDDGAQLALPVLSARLFAQYRAWVPTSVNDLGAIDSEEDWDALPGAYSPDNPLKYGAAAAFSASNGVRVHYLGVGDPTSQESWIKAITKLVGKKSFHGIAPLTDDDTILQLFANHVSSQSTPEKNSWRSLWRMLKIDATKAVVDATTTSDQAVALGVIEDDPDVSGDQFRILRIPAGNADFLSNGVRSGDIVRINYTTDGWGDAVYDEFVVDTVINEDSLRLVSGPSGAISVERKIEVWRELDADDISTAAADKAAALASRKIRAVWPDAFDVADQSVPGYYLAAILAGMRAGNLPQQSLTNATVPGVVDVPRSSQLLSADQMDNMAEHGVMIIFKNEDDQIVVRHALTTAGTGDLLQQEEMIDANVDSMSMRNRDTLRDLIGRVNVVPGVQDIIELRLESNIDQFKLVTDQNVGGQLVDGEVLYVRPHATLPDHMVAVVRYVVPAPLNTLELFETIVV